MAARIVFSVASRRAASARTRRRAERVAVSASASESVERFLLLSRHDRSDPTIDCDGASGEFGAVACGAARRGRHRAGRTPAGTGGCDITAIDFNSRAVTPGSLFVAINGLRSDGHRFIADAVNGARWPSSPSICPSRPSTRRSTRARRERRVALSALAAAFHGNPSADLCVVGVTGPTARPPPRPCSGTRGARPAWRGIDHDCGSPPGDGVVLNPSRLTTPEAPELQADLAAIRARAAPTSPSRRHRTGWRCTGSTTWTFARPSSRGSPPSTWSCTAAGRPISRPKPGCWSGCRPDPTASRCWMRATRSLSRAFRRSRSRPAHLHGRVEGRRRPPRRRHAAAASGVRFTAQTPWGSRRLRCV